MRRTKEEARQTRQRILDEAVNEFWERGYGQSTLEGIARRARLTRGAVHWHFKGGKQEILMALVDEHQAITEGFTSRVFSQPGSAAERIQRLADLAFDRMAGDLHYATLLRVLLFKVERFSVLTPDFIERHKQEDNRQYEALTRLVKQGQQEGVFRAEMDPHDAALMLAAALSGLMEVMLAAPETFPLERMRQTAHQFFFWGLSGAPLETK